MVKLHRKVKLEVDVRNEYREFEPYIYDEPVLDHEFSLDDPVFVMPSDEQMSEAMDGAGWSDDPGTGKPIILPDGREFLNPIPVAAPLSIALNSEPSVNDLVERALKRHFEMLKGAEEIDTIEDADDFGEDEDFVPFSQYEIILRDEAPALKPVVVSPEVAADIDKVEADAVKAVVKKKPPKVDLDEEGAQ